MDKDESRRILTDQTSHDTTYRWCDTEEMRDRVCVQKLVLSTE